MKLKISIFLSLLSAALWGQDLPELSLQGAIDSALQNNYGIMVQKINTEVSATQNTWGATGALPSISFGASATDSRAFREEDQSVTTVLNSSVDLNWTLFRGFSARISKEQLEEMERLSEGTLDIVVENTLISVMNTYYQSLLNLENIRIAEELAALSEDRYSYEQEKIDLGASTTYALLQAKNAFLEDKSSLLSARAAYRSGIRQLNYLMGVDLDLDYTLTEEFVAEDGSYGLTALEEKMLSNNHTLQNQYLSLKMAELDVRQAKSGYYPTLALSASGGYGSTETTYDVYTDLNSSMSNWNTSATLALSYTIYNGGVRKQGLQVARMQEEIAAVETGDLEREMKMTLRQELDTYEVRQEQLVLAGENMEAAKLNLELSREHYENGSINSFNYRDVQQVYMAAALQYQNAIFSVIESHNAILRLTGGIVEAYGA